MTPTEARLLGQARIAEGQALLAAAAQAEAEGRDLQASDLDQFAALDDAARAELADAIEAGAPPFNADN